MVELKVLLMVDSWVGLTGLGSVVKSVDKLVGMWEVLLVVKMEF
jgi:hypothetical protein